MRYHPNTPETRKQMLNKIGIKDTDALYSAVPSHLLNPTINLPNTQGEMAVEREMSALAAQNHSAGDGPFFLGAGCYRHHIPATVDHLIQRSEFLTAYTPYQPEVSQGTLTAMFEFQTYVAALTGQDVANASMYDGATGTAEAALMAMRLTKRKRVAASQGLHPQYREVIQTYLGDHGNIQASADVTNETACLIVQRPSFTGDVQTLERARKICDDHGALLIVVVNEVLSLGLLPAPTEADIVVGEAQSIGVPMGFGGPHLGFFACKEKFMRQMPGRLIGETTDIDGRRAYVLTLATREQHIRRDKATSNICTNVGLCALAFTIHLSLLGETGLKHLARLNHEAAQKLAEKLTAAGFKIENEHYFNEFVVDIGTDAKAAVEKLAAQGIIAGYPLEGDQLLVCVTETCTEEDMDKLCQALKEVS